MASTDEAGSGNAEYDLLVIGGGVNGCGIARDAAGRGISVCLAEMDDLASKTSSASTKLFHGGLRYLEYFEIRLVQKALKERETLLKAMPHISWPMRFVLPYSEDMRFESDTPASRLLATFMPWMKGRRPAWLIRIGLFLYDHLGGRNILPGAKTINLTQDVVGQPLQARFRKAFEYSDCWVEDSRLVSLNARDAAERGATVLTRARVISAEVIGGKWHVTLQDMPDGDMHLIKCKVLINAGGPWVGEIINKTLKVDMSEGVRLVRGSHIVTRRLFDHDKCYFFQGTDGRIIFAIPYETDFTLIGTTEAAHQAPDIKAVCTDEERDYLLEFASSYFSTPVKPEDIVWTYSGVRPLYDDGAKSATAATREYVLKLNQDHGAPVLNIFGGKITTYRKLSEHAVDQVAPLLGNNHGAWTAGIALAGGDFPVQAFEELVEQVQLSYPFLDERHIRRLVRAYGTEASIMLGNASAIDDLGQDFGATLSEREVRWLMDKEFARRAEDVVWRRSKLGLRMTRNQIDKLDRFMLEQQVFAKRSKT